MEKSDFRTEADNRMKAYATYGVALVAHALPPSGAVVFFRALQQSGSSGAA
jgi:hypothetical protein